MFYFASSHTDSFTMGLKLSVKEFVRIGEETVVKSVCPADEHYLVVFEDDGEAGTFYAVDTRLPFGQILDLVQIYSVSAIANRHDPAEVAITWSSDGLSAVLFFNRYPHAVIDFELKEAFCRSNFPYESASPEWSKNGHTWNNPRYQFLAS